MTDGEGQIVLYAQLQGEEFNKFFTALKEEAPIPAEQQGVVFDEVMIFHAPMMPGLVWVVLFEKDCAKLSGQLPQGMIEYALGRGQGA